MHSGSIALHDQAEGLRRMLDRQALRLVLVSSASGAGGAVLNLAAALADAGRDVLVLDGASAKLATALGLSARHDLSDVIAGRRRLDEIVLRGPGRISLLPLGRPARRVGEPQASLLDRCARSSLPVDTLIGDAEEQRAMGACGSPQHVVMVHGASGAAITSAYAVIKRASLECARREFHLVIDGVATGAEAERVFANLARVARRYLEVTLRLLGYVPRDDKLGEAARLRLPVVTAFPAAPAARSFRAFAESIAAWPLTACDASGFDDFMRRLIGSHIPAGARL